MKWQWSLGLLGMLSLTSWNYSTPNAVAQCIQADVSVQYNISGSQEPTDRSNDVKLKSDGACRGNASVTTGVQGNIGGNRRVSQRRKVRQRLVNSGDNDNYSGNTVQIQSNPAIDVYNPADNLDY